MTALSTYLRSIHNQITDDDLDILTKNFRSIRFKKGTDIVVPGQTQHTIFFIKSGVQMYYFDTLGKINILGFSYPPGLCAIPESFFLQKPSRYFINCITDSEMDYLTFDDLQKVFDQSRHMERFFRKLGEVVSAGLINRQIELRSTTIEERFKLFCQRSPHLLQLVPHKHISSYLNIDPTNFSKLYNSVKF